MYIILVYDVNVDRVTKIMKICRQYLEHIQNSVFEGEIKSSDLKELKMKIKKVINQDEDSILIFRFRSDKYFKKEVIGVNKHEVSNII
ncbi:CRISPR-associated endonuclease Cas2 [Candidatus Woesearchaeota archaeon]|nr:CRISPR-associated endonuclease Cas2 [Candidatus Woesearchaeota archaeon]